MPRPLNLILTILLLAMPLAACRADPPDEVDKRRAAERRAPKRRAPKRRAPKRRAPKRRATERAVKFLSDEVARWPAANGCYSCHNNGDAARALYRATRRGYAVDADKLKETSRWLADPGRWAHNGGEGEFNDHRLAALQFGSALGEAVRAGSVESPGGLRAAARQVAELQSDDGSWKFEAAGTIGSPITYGPYLATAQALELLERAGTAKGSEQQAGHRDRIDRGHHWLETHRPRNVLDAAATLRALADAPGPAAAAQRRHCLELIPRGQHASGGWGPYVTSAPEPFDTAVVLLALARLAAEDSDDSLGPLIARGRRYLIGAQHPDGSWPETTRPARAESYSHRLSTAGWATLALLETEGADDPEFIRRVLTEFDKACAASPRPSEVQRSLLAVITRMFAIHSARLAARAGGNPSQ